MTKQILTQAGGNKLFTTLSIAIAIAITIAYLHEVQVLSSIPCQVVSVPRSGLWILDSGFWILDSLRNLDLSGCVSVKRLDHLQT